MKKLSVLLLLIGALLLCSCSAYTSATTDAPDLLPPSASAEESASPSVTPSSSEIEEPVTPNYEKFKNFPLTEDGMIDYEYLNRQREEEPGSVFVSFDIKFICKASAQREQFDPVGGALAHKTVFGSEKTFTFSFEIHDQNGKALNAQELEKLSADDCIVEIWYMGDGYLVDE